jgi:hypothetical protein
MPPTTISATLVLDDSDPPSSTLTVQLDDATIDRRDLTPSEAVDALAVLAPGADAVWAPAQAIVARLQAAVDQGAVAQDVREQALQDWQGAMDKRPKGNDDTAQAFPPETS